MTSDDSSTNSSTEETSKPTRKLRWKLGLSLLTVGLTFELIAWNFIAQDRTFQIFWSMGVMSGTAAALFLWWMFGSGVSWKKKFIGVGLLACLAGAARASLRIDDNMGDMLPVVRFRWSPTPEEKAQEYWKSNPPITTDIAQAVPEPSLTITDADWPQFRGPNRDGIIRNQTLRTNWDSNPPQQLWKHPIGAAWSSFAVVQNFAFTQEQRLEEECVVCYDIKTGEQIWVHADKIRFDSGLGGIGPRATPTVTGTHLYAVGSTGILNCLNPLSGKIIWSTNILEDSGAENIQWGMAGSPLIHNNLVIVSPGGNNNNSVIVYDRLTGVKVWSAGNHDASYAAPRIETLGGVEQLLVFNGLGLTSYFIPSGKELWNFPWTNDPKVNVAQPIRLSETELFIGSGYGTGSAVVQATITAGQWNANSDWTTRESLQMKLKFNDAVLHDGFIYGLDEGILVCLNPNTRKRVWKRGRYGYGQLLLIGDVILVLSESGEAVLVAASPNGHQELAQFQALDSKTWNHPVYVGGLLLVRNGEEAACYDLR